MKYVFVVLAVIGLFGCKNKDKQPVSDEPTYPVAFVDTRLGEMYFWMYDETPNHKAKFIELANEKHYNQFTFNRVIKNFVIQGGCPDSVQYFENSPFLLDPEFVDSIGHHYGALGMGRDGNPEKKSNACQFYVVNKEAGLPFLDGEYMIFGTMIKGYDVLEAIEVEPTNANDQPLADIPLHVAIKEYTRQELSDTFDLLIP
jgi:peptidyl-prolyl cis-trans isomerase B (cyclophilin B)